MSIKHITTDDLRRMKSSEGLIIQGCGGDLQEWVDGINEMLAGEGILRDGSKFTDCSSFEHDGLTCLLFPFEGVNVDVGRLAIWRLLVVRGCLIMCPTVWVGLKKPQK